MRVLDGSDLTTTDSSFTQDTGTEIAAMLTTITTGTTTTTGTMTGFTTITTRIA
jgi:hypothetical protein